MEPHVAGHSTHFLRRLDRVREDQVELALALYNDPDLLRATLARAAVPDGASRVAIALDRGPEPPHVVVTREGKFVTCLGAGMAISGLFVVSRERLDVAAAHVERMRERLAQIDALDGKTRELSRLWDRLGRSGSTFAREDFEDLARWEPLLGQELLNALFQMDQTLQENYVTLRAYRGRRLPKLAADLLEAWYECFWAWAALSVLVHVGDVRERMERLEEQHPSKRGHLAALAAMPARWGIVGGTVRALWVTGRHGRALLPGTKALQPQTAPLILFRELGLGAIAHTSTRARTEALRAIGPTTTEGVDEDEAIWRRRFRTPLKEAVLAPDGGVAAATAAARARAMPAWRMMRERLPVPVEKPEDAPLDVCLAMFALEETSLFLHEAWALDLLDILPALVRAQPADLFLPRAWLRAVPRYEPKNGLTLLDGFIAKYGDGSRREARSPKAAGRNDPCPCGSGKKYKHCCAK